MEKKHRFECLTCGAIISVSYTKPSKCSCGKSNFQHLGMQVIFEPEEEERCRSLLKEDTLFEKIISEQEKEITGEIKSRKAITLSLFSIFVKNLEIPIHTLVTSESTSGKSYVCKRIIKIFPKELFEYRSKITPEAFTYWHTNEPGWTWDGKICYLEDISQSIFDSPTFKVMCSEGSTATVVKNQQAIDLHVEGKPIFLITTARGEPNTEVANRFQFISLDESEKQTYDITLSQALQRKKEEYSQDLVNSLLLLDRKEVYIPYALNIHEHLAKCYSFEDIRMRRDFPRLLGLIKCSCALHQFQRKTNLDGALIATEEDYRIAREVINYITIGTLKGLTHRLHKVMGFCLEEEGAFTAKEIHAKHPIVSLQMWYDYLEKLCERGMLVTELKDVGGFERDGRIIGSKRVTYHKVVNRKIFNLPDFKELPNINSLIGLKGLNDLNGLIGLNGLEEDKQLNELKQLNVKDETTVISPSPINNQTENKNSLQSGLTLQF